MLERQIMFKQMQELQRQKKVQGLNIAQQQNVINQLSFTHNKQSSGVLNSGIPVRDPSQMFMFDRTNLVHGLSTQNQVLQSMGLASHFQGPSNESTRMLNFSKSVVVDKYNDSANEDSSALDPLEQKFLFDSSSGTESFGNMFEKKKNSSDILSLQNGSWSALMQSAAAETSNSETGQQEEWSSLSFQNHHVPISKTDDAFTLSYSNSYRSPNSGFMLTPSSQSQSYVTNQSPQATLFYSGSRQPDFSSDASRETSNIVSVKKEDGQLWSTTRLPNITADLEAFPRSLEKTDATPHNHSCIKGEVKNESIYYDNTMIPQVTSLSKLNCTYGNYKSQPIDQMVESSSQPPGIPERYMSVFKSKKRKFATFEHLSWHKEVTEGYSRLHDISTAELEWAHSACRLPEQLKNSGKEVVDSLWMINRKRRLNLTTQLMQLLFRPAPASVLSKDLAQHCDSVTYYAAKLALGDACSLCSKFAKKMISKSSKDQDLSKVVEGLIDRSKRLEDEFSRLVEKRDLSILEVTMNFQDLIKVSVINRFAMFHTRGSSVTDDAEASSAHKLYPQRYVKARTMPNIVPVGGYCLSL